MLGNFTPRWSIRSYGAAPGSHSHDHYQILWGLEGDLELEVEGKGARVSAGTGLVIDPRDRHDFESRCGSRCLILDSPDIGWSSRARVPQFTKTSDLLARFISEAIEQQIPIDRNQAAVLFAHSWGPLPKVRRARRDIDWEGLSLWIKSRVSAPLSVADVAAKACLSESQFRARCIETLGFSPMQWIRRMRLEQAQLLRSSGMTVAEVAQRTGYDSPSALTAALRRVQKG